MSRRSLSGRSLPSLAELAFERLQVIRQAKARATMAAASSLIPRPPSPLQLEFLGLDVEEAFFGGAAGAGKSEVGIMGGLQNVHVPGFAGSIFRRSKVAMLQADAPLSRTRAWLRPAEAAGLCWWDDGSNSYFFKTRNAKGDELAPSSLHYGYLAGTADQDRYQGAAWQYVFVDELPQWNEPDYLFLFSRLRRSSTLDPSWRGALKMRASGNPGGKGHEFVKERFFEYAQHVATGTTARDDLKRRRERGAALPSPRLYVSPPSREAVELAKLSGKPAQGAHFVPGFVEDNPAYQGAELYAYLAKLIRMTPTQQARLRWGDWDATGDGKFFTEASFKILEREPAGVRITYCRSWDLAATVPKPGTDPDWTVGGKVGVFTELETKAQRVIIPHVKRGQWGPNETDREMKLTAVRDSKKLPIVIEQEGGSAGKRGIAHFKTVLLPGWRVHGIRKTGPKVEYWDALSSVVSEECPLLLVRESPGDEVWIKALITELCTVPEGHDDQADAPTRIDRPARGKPTAPEDDQHQQNNQQQTHRATSRLAK